MIFLKYISRPIFLLALFVVGGMVSCTRDLELDTLQQWGSEALVINPSILGQSSGYATKSAGIDDLMENRIDKIDVFIEGPEVTPYWYHASYEYNTTTKEAAEALEKCITNNWKTLASANDPNLFLSADKTYKIYVVANASVDLTSVTNSADLKARIQDEIAVYKSTHGNTEPSSNAIDLYKLYGSNDDNITTTKKVFLMDGYTTWSPDPDTGKQTITVPLKRAVSKIIVNVSFEESFLASLDGNHTLIAGRPNWRFYSFAFDTPLLNPKTIDPAKPEAVKATQLKTSDARLEAEYVLNSTTYSLTDDQKLSETKPTFTMTAYTYSNAWDQEDAINIAPALIVSVEYKIPDKDNSGNYILVSGDYRRSSSYQYYRIPIVNQDETFSIGRNKIYTVNATISSEGSASVVDAKPVALTYSVADWNSDKLSGGNNTAPVEPKVSYFIHVTPLTYILRGNSTQTVDLVYSIPAGQTIGIQYFNQTGNETDGYTGDAAGTYASGTSRAAWYYNHNGNYRTDFGNQIVQSSITDNGISNGKGTITVSSDFLLNRAIKYIKFRVYLNVDNWKAKGYYRDVLIKHYPVDNIQSYEGAWSSRTTGEENVTLYSITPVEGGTISSTYYKVTREEYNSSSLDKRITAQETVNLSDNDKTIIFGADDGWFLDSACYETGATSFENAVFYNGYYYWVTRSGWVVHTYTYYRRSYESKVYEYSQSRPGTGKWVDWERDNGKTYNKNNVKFTADDNFQAKVWNGNTGDDSRIFAVNVARSGNGNNYSFTYSMATSQTSWNMYTTSGSYSGSNTSMTSLKNNHMYVIQIASTSSTYTVGRPTLDAYKQSQDHVVSPAFMIASQLGAVSSFGSTSEGAQKAAIHCSTYMEVGTDGTRYTGWRLPTAEEIDVIIKYQGTNDTSVTIDGTTVSGEDRAMVPVLTGGHYHTLSGTPKATGWDDSNYAVRCIRDLSAAEVVALNQ